MANVQTFKCEKCCCTCISLFELVSHVRAVHSSDQNLLLSCGVAGCQDVFHSTSTWYQHIRSCHLFEYYQPTDTISESTANKSDTSDHETLMCLRLEPSTSASIECHTDEMEMNPPEKMNPSRSNLAAGMIIKLKEECGLSQRAMNEVINITGFICDHVIDQA